MKFLSLISTGLIFISLGKANNNIDIDDVNLASKLIAGISVDVENSISSKEDWKKHQGAMSKAWERYKKSNLLPMLEWSGEYVSEDQEKHKDIRYPFSGPDILHALHMFPDAENFILCGLEPVGQAPKSEILRSENSAQALAEIRTILEESLRFSFFKTLDMRAELTDAVYKGTLPIMCLFLSGSGYEIKNIERLELNKDGTIINLGSKNINSDAVRIQAKDQNGKIINILYFKTNIANGLIKKSGFLQYLENIPKGLSYVKAASYLMHKSYFSEIRNHLLYHSKAIIQDDSGIPLRYFDQDQWQMSLFGNYKKPIDLFKEHYQEDLRQSYEFRSTKLSFGTGYKWRKGQSNLMLAERMKNGQPSTVIAANKKPEPKKEKSDLEETEVFKSLDFRLKLVAKSIIDKKTTNENKSAFIMNKYLVVSINNGGSKSFLGKTINVVRVGLLNGKLMSEKQIGSIFSVKLSPLNEYPSLLNWTIKNDLPSTPKEEIIYIPSQS